MQMSIVVLNFSFDNTSSSNLLLKNIFIVSAIVFLYALLIPVLLKSTLSVTLTGGVQGA
jgi:hypothetical protein